MVTDRLIVVAVAILVLPYLLAKTLGALAAVVPLVVGASLGFLMQAGINRAEQSAWARKSTLRDRLFGYTFLFTLILAPSIVIGWVGMDYGIVVGTASFVAAVWLTTVALDIAARLTTRHS